MLWQKAPSVVLRLLRDGSVSARSDWHSVKWGLLRALMWKHPSQQHSSTRLQLNCQQTSIMPICFVWTWQLIKETWGYLTQSKNTNRPMCGVLRLVCWRSSEVTVKFSLVYIPNRAYCIFYCKCKFWFYDIWRNVGVKELVWFSII